MLDMDRTDVEEIILCMADIVIENRELRKELEEMREYKKKYEELLRSDMKDAEESSRELLKAIFAGAFGYVKTEGVICDA